MKNKNKPKQRNNAWIPFLLVLVIGIVWSIVTGLPLGKVVAINQVNSPYSDDQLHAFWDSNLKVLLQEQWSLGKLPYPALNDRCLELRKKVNETTGKPIGISISTRYHWASKRISASTGYDETNKIISIDIFVPALVDAYHELEKSGASNWYALFQSQQLVVLMHEMEHTTCTVSSKRAIDIGEESRAWAETCRYTVVPLVEDYHVPINDIQASLYVAWKKSGGDTNSALWKRAIWNSYGMYEGRTN